MTGEPRSVCIPIVPEAASTPTKIPSDEASQSLPPASTGPLQRPSPGNDVTQRTLPSLRVKAINLPTVSTTNSVSPATHGVCEPLISRVHNRSPLSFDVAINCPPRLIAKTVVPSTTGRSASPIAVAELLNRPFARESVHFGWPFLTSMAVTSPDGYGT